MANERVKRPSARVLAPTLAAVLGAAMMSPAAAQEAEAPGATEAAGEDEIVVTGERRSGLQFESSSAVTVLNQDELTDRGVVNLDTLQNQVPGLTVSNASFANMVNIRGVGRSNVGVQAAAGVQIYRDGLPTFNGFFSGAEPYFDLAGVEVYKGPQGTFAGQNSTGGAIFVTSRDPDLDELGGYVQVQAGSQGNFGFQGALNLPISDTLGIRVAAIGEDRDESLYDWSGPFTGDPEQFSLGAARLSVLWEPTDNFAVTLKYDQDYIDHGASPFAPAASPNGFYDIEADAELRLIDRFYRVSADVAYTFDNGLVLRSLSGYQAGTTINFVDFDGIITDPVPGRIAQYRAHEDVLSQEFNLVSPETDRFRYVLGLSYSRDNLQIPYFDVVEAPTLFPVDLGPPIGVIFIPATLTTSLVAEERVTTNTGAFAHFTYDVTPSLHVELGARYNRGEMEQDVLSQINADLGAFGTVNLITAPGLAELPEDDESTTGKLAVSYDIDENNFIYAFVATGHKNAGLNGADLTFVQPTFEPIYDGEDVTDYEIGYRRRMFDNQLIFQLVAYYYQFENYQMDRRNIGEIAPSFSNIPGETIFYGVEAQFDGHFGDTEFNLGVAWAQSELPIFFDDDPNGPFSLAGTCPETGPSTDLTGACLDLTGRTLPFNPEWTVSAGIEHAFTRGFGVLTPRVDVTYLSEQASTVFQRPGEELAARTIVNGQLELMKDDWSVVAFVTNAFNEEYLAAVSGGIRVPGIPRQFGVRFLKNF